MGDWGGEETGGQEDKGTGQRAGRLPRWSLCLPPVASVPASPQAWSLLLGFAGALVIERRSPKGSADFPTHGA